MTTYAENAKTILNMMRRASDQVMDAAVPPLTDDDKDVLRAAAAARNESAADLLLEHLERQHSGRLVDAGDDVDSLADLPRNRRVGAAEPRGHFVFGEPAVRSGSAPDLLARAAETFAARNKTYGDNYLRFGDIMLKMFPSGVELRTAADFNRYGQLFMCMCKLTRYAENFARGGHQDSAHDLIVYAAMMEEVTEQR